jgi:hypothetical protein
VALTHNQQGNKIELTYNQALFLVTGPLHRQNELFMDETLITSFTFFQKVEGNEK